MNCEKQSVYIKDRTPSERFQTRTDNLEPAPKSAFGTGSVSRNRIQEHFIICNSWLRKVAPSFYYIRLYPITRNNIQSWRSCFKILNITCRETIITIFIIIIFIDSVEWRKNKSCIVMIMKKVNTNVIMINIVIFNIWIYMMSINMWM